MHGVVYLRGRIEKIRGYHSDIDLKEELRVIGHILRQKSGIREVICEVDLSVCLLRSGPKIRRSRATTIRSKL